MKRHTPWEKVVLNVKMGKMTVMKTCVVSDWWSAVWRVTGVECCVASDWSGVLCGE